MKIVDRLQLARELSTGKRVLDVGGLGMVYKGPKVNALAKLLSAINRTLGQLGRRKKVTAQDSAFADALRGPAQVASEHRVVDFQANPKVHYLVDMNKEDAARKLRDVIDEFKPEVILCMETLEHVNYHFESMNEFARAVEQYGTTVFVTIPNNGNWVFNSMGWNYDHSVAFFRDIAYRFVSRSHLGNHEIERVGCMQKYVWYWWIIYLISFFQPFGWGFVVRPKTTS